MKYPNKRQTAVFLGIALLFGCTKLELVRVNKVSTGNATEISFNSAKVSGSAVEVGDKGIDQHGFYLSTGTDPTTGVFEKSELGTMSSAGSFSEDFSGLDPGTTYYFKAYLKNTDGEVQGDVASFQTLAMSVPTVETVDVTSISQTSAVSGGNVTDDGGSTVTTRGVCWSTSQNPTVQDGKSTDGNGTGAYISSISGLTCGTTYYVRAYATNATGTGYGTEFSFTTSNCTANPPSVTTAVVTGILETIAQGGGVVVNDGGAQVTAKGVCWSTTANPTISDSKTNDGIGTGGFTSAITGLNCGTTYYVRAYATNESGTSYGSQVEFSTTDCATGVPVVTTTAISSILETTAQGGGDVTDDGGSAVSAKGVVWSTNQNPTTADNNTNDGTGTGGFTSALTNLSCGTTYYVRAYATNENGTSYGDQVNFTTSSCQANVPTVVTGGIEEVSETTVLLGGNVTDDGGATVTAKGIVWSKSQDPTLADAYTTDGSDIGSYSSTMTGLDCGTTYYVKAYATNAAGTGYGDQLTVVTVECSSLPVVTTTDISNVGLDYATGGGHVTEQGSSSVTARGICWSTSMNPTLSDNYTVDGSGIGIFTSQLSGLPPYTYIYVRAYATNGAGTAYGDNVNFLSGYVADYETNLYKMVEIGSQTWMAENLRSTVYSDGTPIPYVDNDADWGALTTSDAACAYLWNDPGNAVPYGVYYTWLAIMNGESSSNSNPSGVQGVCPSGWHVPSDAEWQELEVYLGMDPGVADSFGEMRGSVGGKLKQTGIEYWLDPNVGATNETGFSAVGSGYRRETDGLSYLQGKISMFWTSTIRFGTDGISRYIHDGATYMSKFGDSFDYGMVVRCVKDK